MAVHEGTDVDQDAMSSTLVCRPIPQYGQNLPGVIPNSVEMKLGRIKRLGHVHPSHLPFGPADRGGSLPREESRLVLGHHPVPSRHDAPTEDGRVERVVANDA